MKRLFQIFLSLLFVYLLLNGIKQIYSTGHEITYQLLRKPEEIIVTEKSVQNSKDEIDHYYFTIQINQEKFYYQIPLSSKKKRIIDDVFYAEDNEYQCFLPILKDEGITSDIMCKKKKGNVYYKYQTLKSTSATLKKAVKDLRNKGYRTKFFIDNQNKIEKVDSITFYPNNVQENFDFGITNYKGLYIIDKTIHNIPLFDHDVYTRELSAFVDDYYVVANYNARYDYSMFYFTHLSDGEIYEFELPITVSSDAYITGVIDDNIYIVDRSNDKEYECNITKKRWKEIGNKSSGMQYYENGKWTTVSASRFTLNETHFIDTKMKKGKYYTLFKETEGKLSGYAYYYQKVDNHYRIYRANKQNRKVKTYLFTIDKLDSIQIKNKYVFYQKGNEVHYYSDETSDRTLLMDSELEFNKGITYGFYEK